MGKVGTKPEQKTVSKREKRGLTEFPWSSQVRGPDFGKRVQSDVFFYPGGANVGKVP